MIADLETGEITPFVVEVEVEIGEVMVDLAIIIIIDHHITTNLPDTPGNVLYIRNLPDTPGNVLYTKNLPDAQCNVSC